MWLTQVLWLDDLMVESSHLASIWQISLSRPDIPKDECVQDVADSRDTPNKDSWWAHKVSMSLRPGVPSPPVVEIKADGSAEEA
jgi:hypothetical protein